MLNEDHNINVFSKTSTLATYLSEPIKFIVHKLNQNDPTVFETKCLLFFDKSTLIKIVVIRQSKNKLIIIKSEVEVLTLEMYEYE